MAKNIVKLNEGQIRQIIENSVKRTLMELRASTYMNAARKQAMRTGKEEDRKRAMKFAQAGQEKWKEETGANIYGGYSNDGFGFTAYSPENSWTDFNEKNPHGNTFNKYAVRPDFTKMSKGRKEDFRKDAEKHARNVQNLRNYYKKPLK